MKELTYLETQAVGAGIIRPAAVLFPSLIIFAGITLMIKHYRESHKCDCSNEQLERYKSLYGELPAESPSNQTN